MNLFKSIILYNKSLFQDISNNYKIKHYATISIINFYYQNLPEKYYVRSEANKRTDTVSTYFGAGYSNNFCKTITSKYNLQSLINNVKGKGWYRYG